MITLDDFRRTVDDAHDQVSPILSDLNALYEFVGLPQKGSYTMQAVSDKLSELIGGAIVEGPLNARTHCKNLRRDLVIAHLLDGALLEPYFTVLDTLFYATGKYPPKANEDNIQKWETAIQHAVNCTKVWSHSYPEEHRRELHRKDYMVAEAALRLRAKAYKIKREFANLFIEEESEARLVGYLEKSVAEFGGVNVAYNLFSVLSERYNSIQERYEVVRNPRIKKSQLPSGYLLQLAAKHPFGRSKRLNPKEWAAFIDTSTDYAAMFEVQTYSQFELMFKDTQGLLPFLRELALHDMLFCFTQMRASDAIKIVRGTIGDTERVFPRGYTMGNVLELADLILKEGKLRRGPIVVKTKDLIKALPKVSAKTVKTILDDVFSHKNGANKRFSKPTDAPDQSLPRDQRRGPDFMDKPLLRTPDNQNYVLLDAAMCAPAFLEAMFTLVRDVDGKKFDDDIGPSIEEFLRQEFAAHCISAVTGSYGVAKVTDGECDLIIETADTIIFIETKKKSLTRLSRAGSDITLLIDLSASLLDAQLQAGAHELKLLTDGHLDLIQKDGSTIRFPHNERRVERVAVTLLDYGSFQDRILLSQFLQASMNAQYTVVDTKFQRKFDQLNEKLQELRQQTQELLTARKEKSSNVQPFFNCWFLSVPQILVLLDGVASAEDFKAALWRTRHVTTGSMDFYHDHAYMLALPELASKESRGLDNRK